MARILLTAALDRVRLGSLIQMLLSEGLSCSAVIRQAVTSSDGDGSGPVTARIEGSIGLQEGLLTGARLADLSGEEALLSLMMWSEGSLEVSDELLPGTGFLAMDPLSLMLEALRLQDHWDDLGDRLLVCTKPNLATDELSQCLAQGLTVAEASLKLQVPPIRLISRLESLLEDGIFARGRHQKDKAELKSRALRLPWLATVVEAEKAVSGTSATSPQLLTQVTQLANQLEKDRAWDSEGTVARVAAAKETARDSVVNASAETAAESDATESVSGFRAAIRKATERGTVRPADSAPSGLPLPPRTQLPMNLISSQAQSPLASAPSSAPLRLDVPRENSFASFKRSEPEAPLRLTGGQGLATIGQTSTTSAPTPASAGASATPAEPAAQAAPTPSAPEPDDDIDALFYRLVDLGRKAFKVNDMDGAERLWHQAMAIRPDDRTLRQNLRILQLKKSQNSRAAT